MLEIADAYNYIGYTVLCTMYIVSNYHLVYIDDPLIRDFYGHEHEIDNTYNRFFSLWRMINIDMKENTRSR